MQPGFEAGPGYVIYWICVYCSGRKCPVPKCATHSKPSHHGATHLQFTWSQNWTPLAPYESWTLTTLVKIPKLNSLKLSSLKQSIKLSERSEEIRGNAKPTHKHREIRAITSPDYNPVALERNTSFMTLTAVLVLLLEKVPVLSKSAITTNWSKLCKIQTQ